MTSTPDRRWRSFLTPRRPYTIRGSTLGPSRPRGWVRPGLTVHPATYDPTLPGVDVGCYHVVRADGATLCGRDTRRPNWRDGGWADSELICCKTCGDRVWRRWHRNGFCDGVDQSRPPHAAAGG
jgi:hypothetical protein